MNYVSLYCLALSTVYWLYSCACGGCKDLHTQSESVCCHKMEQLKIGYLIFLTVSQNMQISIIRDCVKLHF